MVQKELPNLEVCVDKGSAAGNNLWKSRDVFRLAVHIWLQVPLGEAQLGAGTAGNGPAGTRDGHCLLLL